MRTIKKMKKVKKRLEMMKGKPRPPDPPAPFPRESFDLRFPASDLLAFNLIRPLVAKIAMRASFHADESQNDGSDQAG